MRRERRLQVWRELLVCASLTLLAACNPLVGTSYVFVQSIQDEETGKYVELGELINFSSWCLAVNVFDDQKVDRKATESREPVIVVCNLDPGHESKLVVQDSCYTLIVGYGSGGIRKNEWSDPESGKTICFGLRNSQR